MKATVHHVGYGLIEYDESFWSGKKNIRIDNKPLTKKARNLYVANGEDGELECRVRGSFLFGASLQIGEDVILITEHCKWYEMFLSMLICVFVLTWGNVPGLSKIFPIIGGAMGGAISGAAMCGSLVLMKMQRNVFIKLLIWLGIFAGTVAVCFVLASLFTAVSNVV